MKKKIIVAHRGGGGGIFENRLETIKNALSKSYIDAVEIDLRLTRDNILVLHHDRAVNINGERIWLDKVDYDRIKHLGIPTFDEVLKLFSSSEKILDIDIKDENCIPYLSDCLLKNNFKKKFYVDFFDINLLLKLQEELPNGEYYLSLTPKDSYDFNRRFLVKIFLLFATMVFSQFIVFFLKRKIKKASIRGISIYHKFATKRFIGDLKDFGYKVFVWGTDREFEIQHFLHSEADGIKTRNISIFEKM